MACRQLSATSIFIYTCVISVVLAYNCYKNTDKASKPLDLSVHSSSIPQSKLMRTKRDVSEQLPGALEFEIGSYLYISDIDTQAIEHNEFAISFWLYLEGGQPTGATVLSMKNTCFKYSPWYFKLYPASDDNGMKSQLVFTMEDVYRQKKSVSLNEYEHHKWFQVTVVNSVKQLRIYVNGVRTTTGEGMTWTEFADKECLRLELGKQKDWSFRGKLSKLIISHQALTARDVKQINVGIPISSAAIWFDDHLSAVKPSWSSEKPPVAVEELINLKTAQTISAPTCGKTVCDDPSMATAYATDPALKYSKTVSLEIIVMANSDGSDQSVPNEDITKATEYISEAFVPHSINWDFETRVISNSTLRRSLMMLDCWPEMIGDGICDSRCDLGRCCNFPATNYDAGDCPGNIGYCTRELALNGRCDRECNTDANLYDSGDCCHDINEFCLNSTHVNRGYYHLREVLNSIPTSDNKLSIVVLNWMNADMLGIASLPWERNADAIFGSLVVSPSALKKPFSYDTLVHELGHVLGLWHVHHGISEVTDCSDECLEREPSLVLGDLCADTGPTYRHIGCADPKVDFERDLCSIERALKDTPYSNYMSYSNGSCSDEKTFTAQQAARMHCYLDLVHNRALAEKQPSAVPLPPQVLYADTQSATLSWLPPLSAGQTHKICQSCDPVHSLTQYVSSTSMTDENLYFLEIQQEYGPVHATSAPDSASCKLTREVWSPTDYYFKLYKCDQTCQFNFTFEHAVEPQSIRIWIPWYNEMLSRGSPIHSIMLVSPTGEVVKQLEDVHIQCDKPFTKVFQHIDTLVNKVVVNTYTPYLAFDAVELKSTPQSAPCTDCHSLKYKVEREPALSQPAIVSDTLFEDKTVETGTQYTYTITAVLGDVTGVTSAPFLYTHNQQFCGNGQLDREEECDDGNFAGGDGCSSYCKVEHGYVCLEPESCTLFGMLFTFFCSGIPSVCWLDVDVENRHCSFKFTNEEDGCGYYVPQGYSDQWASAVTTNGRHLSCSSEHLLLGPPPPGLKCQSTLTELSPPLWLPCQMMGGERVTDSYQLKLGFETPVVATAILIHIATDSEFSGSRIIVSHILEDGDFQLIGNIWGPDCKKNPLIATIKQNLSKPFKRTKEIVLKINSRELSIAAVRLRTFANFDPITVNSCGGSLYDTVGNQCIRPSVTDAPCPPLDLPNSNLTCTGVGDGDTCTAICDLGYETSTVSSTTTCVDGKWGPRLSCDIVTCRRPDVALGYAVCPNGHHFDSVCEIACNPPSQLRGNGTLIKCVESGIWTKPRAACAAVCVDLTTQNAQVMDELCAGAQEVGSRCLMECLPGYYIRGYDQKTRRDKAICQRTGEWDRKCVRIECERIPSVWSGLYTCSDGVNSGSVCTATCPTTQERNVISCLATGRWNSTIAACDTAAVRCPVITGTRQDVTFNCTGVAAGSVCRVSCTNSSLMLYQQTNQDSAIFRDKLHCSNGGDWTEDASSLICDLPCQQGYIGDGWCDSVNNRDVCQWDGGDCCDSTTKTTLVQTFPESCTSECSCNDPEALGPDDGTANRRLLVRDGLVVDRVSDQ